MSGESYWNKIVTSIKPVPDNKKVWAQTTTHVLQSVTSQGLELGKKIKLCVVIVEPRKHKWLQGVLYNMAHVYGGRSDIGIYIFHGTDNYQFIHDIIPDWQNVNYVQLPVANLTIGAYSKLLTTADFYRNFNCAEHVLIFQTDSLIRKPIDEVYFQYSWCGAPWSFMRHGGCGNGGFSLRRVSTMIDICNKYGSTERAEDLYFNSHLKPGIDYPPKDLQTRFSCETIFHPDPCGVHCTYKHIQEPAKLQILLAHIPNI